MQVLAGLRERCETIAASHAAFEGTARCDPELQAGANISSPKMPLSKAR
jgi:hypothetical protein